MDEPDGEYRLAVEVHPSHVHAIATGPRTADNARRFLGESYGACLQAGRDAVLLEMRLAGPSLDPTAIFSVISSRAPAGQTLRRIAYVDPVAGGRPGPAFATNVAANRGVNVRLFADVASAEAWLRSES